jgi:hypothetical protein
MVTKGRTFTIFGNTVIMKRNPWYSNRLFKVLLSIGKKPKKPEQILASPPPWFMNPSAMPQGVYERAKLFSQIASQTAGLPIEQRIKKIHESLATGRKQRVRKVKPPGERFHEKYPAYDTLKGVPAVAPVQRGVTE